MQRRGFQLEVLNPKYRLIGGNFTIGGSGAIATQDGAKKSGGTVTQVGSKDGRYAVAFDREYTRVVFVGCTMTGPDESGFPTTTGSDPQTRNRAVTGFDVQFKAPDAQDDVDPASGTGCDWWALVVTA